jgi:phosphatidylglycerophosphate synthase
LIRSGLLVFEDSPTGSSLASLRVAGLSLLDRQIRTMERAGIKRLRVLLPATARPTLSRHVQKLDIEIEFTTWQTAPVAPNEDYLLLLAPFVHHHSSLSALVAGGLKGNRLLVQTGVAPDSEQPSSAGAFLCAADLNPQSALVANVDPWSQLADTAGADAVAVEQTDHALWRPVHDRKSARAAKSMLFGQVTKTTSGPISRYINARLSIPTSRFLIETGISPHMVTVSLVLTTGLASAYFVTRADEYFMLALSGLSWQMAAVLDRCDGEIARVKLCESKFGAWFDTVTDNIAYLFMYAGIVIGMHRLYPSTPLFIYLGISAVLALLVTFTIMYSYAIKTGSGSLQHYLYALRDMPEDQKGWVVRVIDRYGFVTKRDSFSFFYFLFAVAGLLELAYAVVVIMLHCIVLGVIYTNNQMLKAHRQAAPDERPTKGGTR